MLTMWRESSKYANFGVVGTGPLKIEKIDHGIQILQLFKEDICLYCFLNAFTDLRKRPVTNRVLRGKVFGTPTP